MTDVMKTPPLRKFDLHTHYYPTIYFDKIRDLPSEFSFDKSPSGQTIIKYRGARFFGVTPPMTDVALRLEDMDRVGIDVEVVSLSTPNVFFTDAQYQPEIARMVNDSYAELIAKHPARFKGFASIPMDEPDAALRELHRAIDELKLNGVILLSNIGGKPLTSPEYRPFFAEANRLKLCILLHPMLPANTEPFREYVLGPIVGFMFDTTLAVARMCFDGMFREFPDIRWIVAHLGGAAYLKRLYYDTVNFNPHMLNMVREMIGSDHMVMGSDYPHLLGSIERAVSSIEGLDIPDAEKRRIFEGTALTILNNV
ncbi:MAG: hypothetical protein DMF70_04240 [Acidobacteria bacterium]|nr:MAG: hypothetical protein DMF70_04240 [Acidobacteriota bacterium]